MRAGPKSRSVKQTTCLYQTWHARIYACQPAMPPPLISALQPSSMISSLQPGYLRQLKKHVANPVARESVMLTFAVFLYKCLLPVAPDQSPCVQKADRSVHHDIQQPF